MFNRLKHSDWLRYVGTLIIGGLLVALGYLIGDSTPNVQAQDNIARFETIACKMLVVSDGNPKHGQIVLAFLDGAPVLILSDHAGSNKSNIEINLSTRNNAAALRLTNRHKDGSHIGLVAGRGESALMTMMSENRLTNALDLVVGADGSGIKIENELILSRGRVR